MSFRGFSKTFATLNLKASEQKVCRPLSRSFTHWHHALVFLSNGALEQQRCELYNSKKTFSWNIFLTPAGKSNNKQTCTVVTEGKEEQKEAPAHVAHQAEYSLPFPVIIFYSSFHHATISSSMKVSLHSPSRCLSAIVDTNILFTYFLKWTFSHVGVAAICSKFVIHSSSDISNVSRMWWNSVWSTCLWESGVYMSWTFTLWC